MRTFFIVKIVDDLFLKKKFQPVGKNSYQLEKNSYQLEKNLADGKKFPDLINFYQLEKKSLPVRKKILLVGKKVLLRMR